jgi:hypothetical protein
LTPRVDIESGGFGFLQLKNTPEHGWPLRYVERDPQAFLAKMLTNSANYRVWWKSQDIWLPWQDVRRFHRWALAFDVLVWLAIVLAATSLAQFWRSRRRAIWQPRLIDLIAATTVVALIVGWFASERLAGRRERQLVEAENRRQGEARYPDQFGAAVPLFVPGEWRLRYVQELGRVRSTTRDSGVACRFSRLTLYTISGPQRDWASDLAQMSQLEGLDFSLTSLPYLDATRRATVLSELPALPRLRAVNLYARPATDADMAWLAKCQRLESIDLSNTAVGNEGLRYLSTLPRLRRLHLSSNRVTDNGCRLLAEFPALEELHLASSRITDAGVRELESAGDLQTLSVTASASQEAFAGLRAALPECSVSTARYRD